MKNKKSPGKMSSAMKKKKQLRTIFVSLIAVAGCLLGVFLALTVNKIMAKKADSDKSFLDAGNILSENVILNLDAIAEVLEDDGDDEEYEVRIYLYRPYEADINGDGSTYFADYDNKRILASISESEGLISQGWYQYECVYVKYYDASLDSTVVEILPIGRFDSNIHTAITEKEYNEIKDGGGDVVVKENCTHCGSDEHTTEEHICKRCGETGHDEKTCTAKICLLCNEKGHTAEEHVCERCGGKGHLKEECPAPSCSICNTVGHSYAEHPCTKCGGKGHDASTCKDKCTICNQTGHDAKNHPCTKCGGKGHDASACTVKICGICKAQGHVAGEHPCTKCGGKGHDASACTVKICAICNAQGHVATEHECTKCGTTGHDASTCKDKCTICNQTGHDAENHICTKCNKKGHAEKDCTAKICTICKGLGKDGVGHLFTEHLCTNCNKNGHDASACTVKKCNSCTEQFTSQDALDKHVAEKHTKCADCQKTGHASGTCCKICGNGTTSHDDSGHPCTKCGGKGHDASACTVKICEICKAQGHVAGEHPCTKCGGKGHDASTCYKCKVEGCTERFNSEADLMEHMNVRHTTCADCGKTGHASRTCCSICGDGTTAHDDGGHLCTKCGGDGHDASICAVGMCAICKSDGHEMEDCPLRPESPKKLYCPNCNTYDHNPVDCPYNNRQLSITCQYCGTQFSSESKFQVHIAENHTCGLCGEVEHTSNGHPCDKCGGTGHLYAYCPGCTRCGDQWHHAGICRVPYCELCAQFRVSTKNTHNTEDHKCSNCGEYGHEIEVDESSCPQPWQKFKHINV